METATAIPSPITEAHLPDQAAGLAIMRFSDGTVVSTAWTITNAQALELIEEFNKRFGKCMSTMVGMGDALNVANNTPYMFDPDSE